MHGSPDLEKTDSKTKERIIAKNRVTVTLVSLPVVAGVNPDDPQGTLHPRHDLVE